MGGLAYSTRESDSASQTTLLDGANDWLDSLPESALIDFGYLTPSSTSNAKNQTISITGSIHEDGSDPDEFLIIDLRLMPDTTQLELNNISKTLIIGKADVTGGQGNNSLTADGSSQYIHLGAGDDILDGGPGSDTVSSASGDDLLYGSKGHDSIAGGSDDDHLFGGLGADTLLGQSGHDTLEGGEGHDILRGSSGNDLLLGDAGDDLLHGGSDNDTLSGDAGRDTLTGGNGSDTFTLARGKDTIRDFSINEGDFIDAPDHLNLRLIQRDNHLLLKDSDHNIKTRLLNINRDDLITYQPNLVG